MNETHMNITVDFSLLSAELTGAAEKNENGIEFLVMPQSNTASDLLPLDGMVNGINDFFMKITESDEFKLDASDILEKIKEIVGEIALAVLKFSIKQIFIHFIKSKNGKVRFEYAFSIGIDLSDEKAKKDIPYTQLRSMTFGIWNTDNKKVIEKMGLLDISEQLG